MKKLFKKILLGFSSIVACTSLFMSCEKNEDGKKALIPIEIWYSPYSSAEPPLPEDWFGYKIIEEQLGIKLKANPLPSKKEDQIDYILRSARSNALPDFFMVSRDILLQLVKDDKVARVDRMFEMMPNRTRMMYDDTSKKNAQFDGLTYGLCQIGTVEKNEGILIRKDWLDKLHLEIPVTTEDYINVMTAFTYNDPDGNGKDDTYGFGAFIETNNHEGGLGRRFSPFFGAFGVAGTCNSTKDNCGLNVRKPEFYEAMDFIRRIVTDKVIDPNWSAYKKDDFRDAWKSGKFGIMREQNGAFALESNYLPFDKKFPTGEWILIDPPVGPNGKSSVGCFTQSYRTFAVSKRASELGKMPALAKLLEWMSTDGYNIIAYGLEGENYTIDAYGNVSTKDLKNPELAYTKKEITPLIQLRNLVFYGSDKELLSRYPKWYTQNGKEMDPLKLLRNMQKKKWTQAAGVPTASSELINFYKDGLKDFIIGKRNLTKDNWNAWLEEFDKHGGNDWNNKCIDYLYRNNIFFDE